MSDIKYQCDSLTTATESRRPDSLVGRYFRNVNGWAGCVIAEIQPGHLYLVEIFDPLIEDSMYQELVPVEMMLEMKWRFYDTGAWLEADCPREFQL